jgi:Tfp pilus assembly protein PilN
MKRINLIPDEARRISSAEWLAREFLRNKFFQLAMGILLFIIGFSAWEMMSAWRYSLRFAAVKREYNMKNEELLAAKQQYEALVQDGKKAKKDAEVLNKRLDTLQSVLKERVDWSRALLELPGMVPEKLWLKNVKFEKDTLTIQGEAVDNKTIAQFMKSLDDSGIFGDTGFNYTKRETTEEKKAKEAEKKAELVMIGFEVTTHFKAGL